MNIKTIIFDLDGTIANTLPLCIAAFKRSIEPLINKAVSDEEIIATFGPSEEGTIRQLIPGLEKEGAAAYLKHYKDLHYTCPVPFEGVEQLLEFLIEKDVQLGMVTGKGPHSTAISLQQFGLAKYFDTLETGSPEGPNKVAGVRNIINRLNADYATSIYVGDAPSDIRYCREVGIPVVAAAWAATTNYQELEALHPDWLFHSVAAFRQWIAGQIN